MKKIFAFVAILAFAAMMLTSCNKERTTYTVQFNFDNTDMHTNMVKVFECIDSAATGKWLGEHYHYDTMMVGGEAHVMVSGKVEGVASRGANELWVYAEGDDETGFHDYKLDTIYKLSIGEDNVFTITPDSKWIKNPLYD